MSMQKENSYCMILFCFRFCLCVKSERFCHWNWMNLSTTTIFRTRGPFDSQHVLAFTFDSNVLRWWPMKVNVWILQPSRNATCKRSCTSIKYASCSLLAASCEESTRHVKMLLTLRAFGVPWRSNATHSSSPEKIRIAHQKELPYQCIEFSGISPHVLYTNLTQAKEYFSTKQCHTAETHDPCSIHPRSLPQTGFWGGGFNWSCAP